MLPSNAPAFHAEFTTKEWNAFRQTDLKKIIWGVWPRRLSLCGWIVLLEMLAVPASAAPYGVVAYGNTTTTVPVIVSIGANEVVLQAPDSVAQGFNLPLSPQSKYDAPTTGGARQETYFDPNPNANGIFTSTSSAFINTLSLSDGVLRGWITASASTLDANLAVVTGASVEAHLIWQDTLTVTSATLAAGTPVQLGVANHLSGELAISGSPANVYVLSFIDLGDGQTFSSVSFHNTYTTPQVINLDQLGVLNTRIGDTVTIEEQLHLVAQGSSFSAEENISNTAYTRISPLTSGVNIVSASGVNYAAIGTPILNAPEPSSWFLMLIGCTVFGVRSKLPKF